MGIHHPTNKNTSERDGEERGRAWHCFVDKGKMPSVPTLPITWRPGERRQHDGQALPAHLPLPSLETMATRDKIKPGQLFRMRSMAAKLLTLHCPAGLGPWASSLSAAVRVQVPVRTGAAPTCGGQIYPSAQQPHSPDLGLAHTSHKKSPTKRWRPFLFQPLALPAETTAPL